MNTCDKLARVAPYRLDGAPWWPLREICDALSVSVLRSERQRAYQLIATRRYVYVSRRRFDKRRTRVIDREGVERLIIRYGGRTSRRELLAALDQSAAMTRSIPRPPPSSR